MAEPLAERRSVVLVSGLSGSGKASALRALEDLGYEAVDNPPLPLMEQLAASTQRPLAIGVDCRTRGFDADKVLETLGRLRADPAVSAQLVYTWAERDVLLRRYGETRRRHPLSPAGPVAVGLETEEQLTAPLRLAADLVIDTSELPLPGLRQMIERRFGTEATEEGRAGLLVSLMSFAYPAGLPRQADLVFDARFLRNPHYEPTLRNETGLNPAVGAYIGADRDYPRFYDQITALLELLLPRFVEEGKKYVVVAVGCTGGRHRSVHLVETLAGDLRQAGWRLQVTHRELEGSVGQKTRGGQT
jgi:RNase adapter protein RapZ